VDHVAHGSRVDETRFIESGDLPGKRVDLSRRELALRDELAAFHVNVRAYADGRLFVIVRPEDDRVLLVIFEVPLRLIEGIALAVLVGRGDDDLERARVGGFYFRYKFCGLLFSEGCLEVLEEVFGKLL